MATEPGSPGIVVGVDGSPSSDAAVEWAAQDAEMRKVALTLVHIVTPVVPTASSWSAIAIPADYSRLQEDHARDVLERAHNAAAPAVSPGRASQIHTEALYGPVVPTLVDFAERADLMVVGCRGLGAVDRALLGSVSSGLVHHARCPVAVIHEEALSAGRSPKAPVVVGVDGSPASELATEIAFDEASRRGVELVALHAWSDLSFLDFARPGQAPIEWANLRVEEEEVLAERLSGWQSRYPDVVVHKIVVADRPAPRLLEQAETAQLIVVGSHGRGGFTGMLLGSVSRAVVNAAQIPVIIARLP